MQQNGPLMRVRRNPWSLVQGLDRRRMIDWVDDEIAIKCYFRARTGESLNLENPRTFNEKLQWLKLHDRNPLYTMLVDKVHVKNWVASKIGTQYVTPTYAVWDSVEEVDLNDLPEQFVLKTNHDNGSVCICKDKGSFDFDEAKVQLNRHLNRNFFYEAGREWPYKNVKPLVFAEEYLEPSGNATDLADYKVMCFGGKPKLIQVHHGRNARHTQDFYDVTWNRLKIMQEGLPMAPLPDERPVQLEEVLMLSKNLSEGMAHVRVDWFIVKNRPYFGEMTLYDASGFDVFTNPADDERIGGWIDLSLAYGPK